MDHLVNRVHQWKGGTLFSPITGEHQAVVDTLVPFTSWDTTGCHTKPCLQATQLALANPRS